MWLVGAAVCFQSPTAADRHANASIASFDQQINRAAQDFFVGNLYMNRKCTGAMVGAHPFGGFNMSGTDSKAGGPDYLLLFLQAHYQLLFCDLKCIVVLRRRIHPYNLGLEVVKSPCGPHVIGGTREGSS